MNRYLSDATAAGELDDVAPAWDGDNGQWWDWYIEDPLVSGDCGSSSPTPHPARSRRVRGTPG